MTISANKLELSNSEEIKYSGNMGNCFSTRKKKKNPEIFEVKLIVAAEDQAIEHNRKMYVFKFPKI